MRSFTGITPLAHRLVSSTIMGQRILPLPQPCGLNCTYSVSVPSFAFECQDGVQLPAEMSSNKDTLSALVWREPFWNATSDPTADLGSISFYVYWKSRTESGTNGTARCTVGRATYDFTVSRASLSLQHVVTIVLQVRILNGQQSVSYNVAHTGPLLQTEAAIWYQGKHILQLFSLSNTTLDFLLGDVFILHGATYDTSQFRSSVILAAFFDPSSSSGTDLTWGDVSRGIEQLSHNVSAAILTMDLGVQDSTCIVSTQDIIYEYNWKNLWLPYGVSVFCILTRRCS